MAQLTDDCFAFSGPLLPIPDMERMIAAVSYTHLTLPTIYSV